MIKDLQLLELIGDIHDLTLNPENIERVQGQFCAATGAVGVHFVSFDENNVPLEGRAYSALGAAFAQEASDAYLNEYSMFDIDRVTNYHITSKGRAISNEELTPDHDKKTNIVYNEYFPRFAAEEQLIFGATTDTQEHFTISQARSREQGEFTKDERQVFELLSNQAFKAFSRRSKFVDVYGKVSSLVDVINNKDIAYLLVDKNWKLSWANRQAQELISSLDTLSFSHGKIRLGNFPEREELETLVAQASFLSISQRQRIGSIIAHLSRDKYIIDVFSLKHDSLLYTRSVNSALLAIRQPKQNRLPCQEILKNYFGLTPSETKLALAIAENKSIKEYASENNLKESTVRSTMKIVLDKTGVRRQAELVTKIASLSS